MNFQTKLKDLISEEQSAQIGLIELIMLLVPSEYLTSFIASAYIGVLQQWLNSDGKESTLEMARILSTITMKGPFFAAGLKK